MRLTIDTGAAFSHLGKFPILGNHRRWAYAAATENQLRRPAMQKSQHTRNYEQLLDELRQARKTAGLTQGEVAKKLGTYATFVSKCEAGERRIDVIELAAFCKVYGVKLTDFLHTLGLD